MSEEVFDVCGGLSFPLGFAGIVRSLPPGWQIPSTLCPLSSTASGPCWPDSSVPPGRRGAILDALFTFISIALSVKVITRLHRSFSSFIGAWNSIDTAKLHRTHLRDLGEVFAELPGCAKATTSVTRQILFALFVVYFEFGVIMVIIAQGFWSDGYKAEGGWTLFIALLSVSYGLCLGLFPRILGRLGLPVIIENVETRVLRMRIPWSFWILATFPVCVILLFMLPFCLIAVTLDFERGSSLILAFVAMCGYSAVLMATYPATSQPANLSVTLLLQANLDWVDMVSMWAVADESDPWVRFARYQFTAFHKRLTSTDLPIYWPSLVFPAEVRPLMEELPSILEDIKTDQEGMQVVSSVASAAVDHLEGLTPGVVNVANCADIRKAWKKSIWQHDDQAALFSVLFGPNFRRLFTHLVIVKEGFIREAPQSHINTEWYFFFAEFVAVALMVSAFFGGATQTVPGDLFAVPVLLATIGVVFRLVKFVEHRAELLEQITSATLTSAMGGEGATRGSIAATTAAAPHAALSPTASAMVGGRDSGAGWGHQHHPDNHQTHQGPFFHNIATGGVGTARRSQEEQQGNHNNYNNPGLPPLRERPPLLQQQLNPSNMADGLSSRRASGYWVPGVGFSGDSAPRPIERPIAIELREAYKPSTGPGPFAKG